MMPTLKEMNYREQEMPNGCWNCKHVFNGQGEPNFCQMVKSWPNVKPGGICDHYKKVRVTVEEDAKPNKNIEAPKFAIHNAPYGELKDDGK